MKVVEEAARPIFVSVTSYEPDWRYRDDRMRAMAEGNDIAASVASATRPPGKSAAVIGVMDDRHLRAGVSEYDHEPENAGFQA